MKTTKSQKSYVEWLNAEEMHFKTQEWLSELKFIKSEQAFLEKLIETYQLELNSSKYIKTSENIITKLRLFRKETKKLLGIIEVHNDKLKIMVDDIVQPKEEEEFKKVHLRLISNVASFLKRYKQLKAKFYNLIKEILKGKKQKLLVY